MHRTIVAAAAVLLIGAGAGLAQPPGITREMIERSLPLEGAPLAVPGPYKVTSEKALRLARLSGVLPSGAGRLSEEGHAARDGMGQRWLRDRQHALLGLFNHHRFARLFGAGHASPGRRCAAAGDRR